MNFSVHLRFSSMIFAMVLRPGREAGGRGRAGGWFG